MAFWDLSGTGICIAPNFSFLSVSSAYTLISTSANPGDFFIYCNATGGAFNVSIPVAHTAYRGRIWHIKKTDASANAVTLLGTIEGVVNPTLPAQYNSKTIYCDGTSWLVLAST